MTLPPRGVSPRAGVLPSHPKVGCHRQGWRHPEEMQKPQPAQVQLGASQPFRDAAAPEKAARTQEGPLPPIERRSSAVYAERPSPASRAAEGELKQSLVDGSEHRAGRGYRR